MSEEEAPMSVTFEEDTEAKVEIPAPQEVTPDVVQKKAKKPRTESQKAALLRAREALTTRRKKVKEIDDELGRMKMEEHNELLRENQRLRERIARRAEVAEPEPEVAEAVEKPRPEPAQPAVSTYQQRLMVMSQLGF